MSRDDGILYREFGVVSFVFSLLSCEAMQGVAWGLAKVVRVFSSTEIDGQSCQESKNADDIACIFGEKGGSEHVANQPPTEGEYDADHLAYVGQEDEKEQTEKTAQEPPP